MGGHKSFPFKVPALREEPMSYQLVGRVKATKAMTGSGCESTTRLTGTETLPRLLREAAVENHWQWAQA